MAYGRYARRRPTTRKRVATSRTYGARRSSLRAVRSVVKKEIRRITPVETHFLAVTEPAPQNITKGGFLCVPLNLIDQGDDFNMRSGLKAYIKAFSWKGEIDCSILDVATVRFKWWLLQRSNDQGAAKPVLSDFLTDTSMPIISMRKPWTESKLRVLKSGLITVDDTVSTETRLLSIYHKFKKPLVTTYNTTTSAQSALANNGLYFGITLETPGTPVTPPTIRYTYRTYFTS